VSTPSPSPFGGEGATSRTLVDKLWDRHLVADLGDGVGLIAIDRLFLHERTGAVALRSLAASGRAVADPSRVFAVTDHIVDTRPGRSEATTLVPGGAAFIADTRAACAAAGIRLFDVDDPDQGIVHVTMPELGLALPGSTIVCPDSHTCTQGALGALAWGIGSTEAEHALATGTLRVQRPRTMRVWIEGALGPHVGAKDLALHIIARHGAAGGQGYAVEYAGPGVAALGVEARMTLANMATEFAAFSATIEPDAATLDWLRGRRHAPAGPIWDAALADWARLRTDEGAVFDAEIMIDARTVEPMVSWGTSPEESVGVGDRVPAHARAPALGYMGLAAGQPLAGLGVDTAFIGSCTNARLSDLQRAATILRGRRVAPGVRAIAVPGSQAVKRAAEADGTAGILQTAGFEWRESGCAMCFYAGGEHLGEGARAISTTNRNFEGRQGPRTRTHIASPETVAASALAGAIADPRAFAVAAMDHAA